MNPTVSEILMGNTVAITTPQPPEAGGDYAASRAGMLATLNMLAAQEAEHGVSIRVWENRAIRRLFAQSLAYDTGLGGRLSQAAAGAEDDLGWTFLDAVNADLRRLLIALHEAVEAAGDTALDRRILALYRDMAHARRLEMPGM